MASRIKLNGNEIKRLKNDRRSCDEIKEDLERAIRAGVPNVPQLIERLDYLIDRIEKLLAMGGAE